MSSRLVLPILLFVAGLLVLGAFYVMSRPAPAPAPVVAGEDEPGPYLVIQVAGEANGEVVIDLAEDVAPGHVERMVTLAEAGAYDDVVFHRVINGFMAQTGDVEHGKYGQSLAMAGTGGSDLPDLEAEFSTISFTRGIVGMARSQSPDSANSQFFITFAPATHLDGQYTVVGRVTEGMEVVDAIKRGDGGNGRIRGEPDRMVSVTVRN